VTLSVQQLIAAYFASHCVSACILYNSESLVNVQFKQFEIGALKVKAPAKARGALDTTYLDNTLRLSRGDKGNIFVLIKEP
jgi:PAP_fibrillin